MSGVDIFLQGELDSLSESTSALAERIQALESSICYCQNCVMHRDKARHGKTAPAEGWLLETINDAAAEVASWPQWKQDAMRAERDRDMAPAWQRAKVGDRVNHRTEGVCKVTHVAGADNGFRLGLAGHDGCGWVGWVKNEDVLSILPPACALCGGSKQVLTAWDRPGGRPGNGLRACPKCCAPEPAAPVHAPPTEELKALLRDYGKYARDKPEASVQDARSVLEALLDHVDGATCRHESTKRGGAIWTICEECGEKWADDRGGFTPYADPPAVAAARSALSAGLIAGAPQPISIDRNTALDTYYAAARKEYGTASDALMAVLKLIPNLAVRA